jgi:hypothetical protein
MLLTPFGILIAEQGSGEVTRLTEGNLKHAPAFATGLEDPTDLALLGTQVFAVSRGGDAAKAARVFDITSGGDYARVGAFAFGQNFIALTSTGGSLYASSDTRDSNGAGIWDITNGGDYAAVPAWVRIAGGRGDTMFEASPAGVPEPSTLGMVGTVLLAGVWLARRFR